MLQSLISYIRMLFSLTQCSSWYIIHRTHHRYINKRSHMYNISSHVYYNLNERFIYLWICWLKGNKEIKGAWLAEVDKTFLPMFEKENLYRTVENTTYAWFCSCSYNRFTLYILYTCCPQQCVVLIIILIILRYLYPCFPMDGLAVYIVHIHGLFLLYSRLTYIALPNRLNGSSL